MARFSRNQKKFFWILSSLLVFTLNFLYFLEIPIFSLLPSAVINFIHILKSEFAPDDIITVSIVLGLVGPATIQLLESKWRRDVCKYLPKLVEQLVEGNRVGLDIVRSLEHASATKLGPLTNELKKLHGRIALGVPFDEALNYFSKSLDTDLSTHISLIIANAFRGGGNLQLVLDTVNRHIIDLQTLEAERRATMRIFVIIIYVAIFVFLFADALIAKNLFVAIEAQREGAASLFGSAPLSASFLNMIAYHIAIIQAIFGGLVCGKIGEGSFVAGLKHVVIMVMVTFLTFLIYVR